MSVRKLSFEGNVIARSEERTTKQSLYFQEIASLLLVARNDENIPIWLVCGQTLFNTPLVAAQKMVDIYKDVDYLLRRKFPQEEQNSEKTRVLAGTVYSLYCKC